MAEKTRQNIQEKAVRAAMALAAERGWEGMSLADVARRAKIGLAQMHEHFEDKDDILRALGRMIDRRVLESAGQADNSGVSPRDRLFDILMERFEALEEFRLGVKAVLSALGCDPRQAVIGLPHLARSMAWMLEAAGVETGGWRGAVRIAGLTALYLHVLKAWAEDDSPDLPKTMAALDKNLGRAHGIMERFGI